MFPNLSNIIKIPVAFLAGIALASVVLIVTYEGVRLPLIGQVIDGRVQNAVKDATSQMVTRFERDVLAAQLAKERDLRLKGSQALEEYRKRAAAALSVEQSDNDRMEQEIADYEAKLADANRCRITPDLRKWLQSK
jgi:hypothetical protein